MKSTFTRFSGLIGELELALSPERQTPQNPPPHTPLRQHQDKTTQLSSYGHSRALVSS